MAAWWKMLTADTVLIDLCLKKKNLVKEKVSNKMHICARHCSGPAESKVSQRLFAA